MDAISVVAVVVGVVTVAAVGRNANSDAQKATGTGCASVGSV